MINKIVFNAESAYYYIFDDKYKRMVDNANGLLCDSFSLSLVLMLKGINHKRLNGPDFMHYLLTKHASKKIFIIGGTNKSHKLLLKKYFLQKVKFDSSLVNTSSIDRFKSIIYSFKPDFIIFCLGLYKQEMFISEIHNHFKQVPLYKNCLITGCGAAVDFLSGTKKRSGTRWQRFGLEWLPRLFREPRMFIRIIRSFIGCLSLLFLNHNNQNNINKFITSFDD